MIKLRFHLLSFVAIAWFFLFAFLPYQGYIIHIQRYFERCRISKWKIDVEKIVSIKSVHYKNVNSFISLLCLRLLLLFFVWLLFGTRKACDLIKIYLIVVLVYFSLVTRGECSGKVKSVLKFLQRKKEDERAEVWDAECTHQHLIGPSFVR